MTAREKTALDLPPTAGAVLLGDRKIGHIETVREDGRRLFRFEPDPRTFPMLCAFSSDDRDALARDVAADVREAGAALVERVNTRKGALR